MAERPPVDDWATDFDHLSDQWAAEGPEILADLRQRCPVAHTDRFFGAYLVTRYDDVVETARDTDTFSSRITLINDNHPDNVKLELPPITLDPPEHGPIRKALLPSFNPREVDELEPFVAEVTARLLDSIAERDHVDGALDFAQLLPVEVMGHLFDVPPSLGPTFRRWVDDMLKDGLVDLDIARRASREIQAFFAEKLRERREAGASATDGDLISMVLHAEAATVDGSTRPFTEREQIGALFVLMLGGIDTTWSALGSSLFHLATHPDDLARLAAEPELIPTAVEEFLRFYSPVTIARVIDHDADIGGCPVGEGQRLLLSFPSANRDESHFDRPDEVIIDRQKNRHLAFGVGVHRCLGSNLARMELRVALTAWLERFPLLRASGRPRRDHLVDRPGPGSPQRSPPGADAMTDPQPLAGLKVVELGHWVAGPAVGGVLSDWGAEVIKVESAVGDPMRHMFPPLEGSEHSPSFAAVNRGKRSVTLDLQQPDGFQRFEALLGDADVFVSNLRPSALQRLDLDPEAVAERYPRVVYCSVTAYGWEGPDRERAGYDLAGFFGRAGVLHQLTPEAGAPAPYLNGIGDMFTAMSAVAGLLAALRERDRTGIGGFVEASLLRTGMWSIGAELNLAANGGSPRSVADRADTAMPLFNVYQAGDGKWFVLVGPEADRHLPKVLAAAGRPDVQDDPRFADGRSIARNRREFIAILDECFARRPLDEWIDIFDEHDVWWAPVQSLQQVADDPQAHAAGAWVELDDGTRGVDAPVRFNGVSRGVVPNAPRLGSDEGDS